MEDSPESEAPKIKRRRNCVNGRKRTGCVTCKIRRVKCDEEKPACRRCTSTGRTCDGYANPTPTKQGKTAVNRQLSLLSALTSSSSGAAPTDRRAWEFFTARVAPTLGILGDKFWNQIALQHSSREPAIKNALLAVSAVYEQCEKNNANSIESGAFALQSYNKAIRLLVEDTASPEARKRTFLIACVLFTCIEFIRGDFMAAEKHIRFGAMILESVIGRNPLMLPPPEVRPTRSESELTTEVESIFQRLKWQTALFDRSCTAVRPTPLDPERWPSSISSLQEARDLIYDLANASIDPMAYHIGFKDRRTAGMEIVATQIRLKTRYEAWFKMFRTFFTSNCKTWTPIELRIARILIINGLVMSMLVATCLENDETVFDAYHTEFETIVELASESVHVDNPLSTAPFYFDLGIIPSMQFVGSKCRYPILRRRVLKILRYKHWREALFDSHRSYRFIHAIMLTEEADLPGRVLGTGAEKTSEGLPPEASRVKFADLWPFEPEDKKQRLTLTLLPNGLEGEPVTLQTWIATEGELPPLESWLPDELSGCS